MIMMIETWPWLFRSLTSSRIIAPSLAPIAASGSSSSSTLAFEVTARATAMAWRWPPDSLATSESTEGMFTPIRSSSSWAVRRMLRLDSSVQRVRSRFRNMLW